MEILFQAWNRPRQFRPPPQAKFLIFFRNPPLADSVNRQSAIDNRQFLKGDIRLETRYHRPMRAHFAGKTALFAETTPILASLLLLGSHSAGREAPVASPPAVPASPSAGAETDKVPRFSVDYMDKSVAPGDDFFHYAAGAWIKNNPVPADKSRWGGFDELQEYNWRHIHAILESASTTPAPPKSPARQVGDFFLSAMDTNRLEQLAFQPLAADFARIAAIDSPEALLRVAAELDARGLGAMFGASASRDAKNSGFYAFHLGQGGLGLPDRDYYLSDGFAKQREAYAAHISKMLTLAGESQAEAGARAKTILGLETELAKASKSRTDLRDPIANYHKFAVQDLPAKYPALPLKTFLSTAGVGGVQDVIVGQPEFFAALDELIKGRPLADWRTYLKWHLLSAASPFLHAAAEEESFAFYGTVLRGQPAQEPRWQRAAKVVDGSIGEALGQLFVEKYFPPAAKVRMAELIGNLKAVFRDRLIKVDWMTEATRAKALAKFDRFTQKIGYPDKFRDYSRVEIRPDDFLGNIERAAAFESKREMARVGKPVDKTEWHMTPQTVNAYFNPLQNEIVFPAGILQPPFFDVDMDDPVNYGAIGVVIGHEITHGYDDEGRKYDAAGNLNEWWTEADAKAFDERAQKVVDQYNGYDALPGLHVNGRLTLGENLADLGGTSIAYEAMERALARDPAKRRIIDGFTPEQRFFLSLAQLWRINWREAELRRRIVTDPHSPPQFRAIGPHVNMAEFYEAFGITPSDPMWRPPALRAKVW
jgi:putative endopeptidase